MPEETETTEDEEDIVPVEDAVQQCIEDSSLDEEAMQDALDEFRESERRLDHRDQQNSEDEEESFDEMREFAQNISAAEEYASVAEINLDDREITVNINTDLLEEGNIESISLHYEDEHTSASHGFAFLVGEDTVTVDLDNVIERIESEAGRSSTESESSIVEETAEEVDREVEDAPAPEREYDLEAVASTHDGDTEAHHELTSETEMIERDRNVYNVSNISDERRLRTMAGDIETRVDHLLSKRQRIVEKLERMQEGEE